jgi:hypothetical protein
MLERELLSEERELPSEERELLSDEAELEVELSDELCELVELVDREVEIEQPTRRNNAGTSAMCAGPKPRMCARQCTVGAKGDWTFTSALSRMNARECARRARDGTSE